MTMPVEGDTAPGIVLPAHDGQTFDLAARLAADDCRGAVVFFYPKAATPG